MVLEIKHNFPVFIFFDCIMFAGNYEKWLDGSLGISVVGGRCGDRFVQPNGVKLFHGWAKIFHLASNAQGH